MRSSVPAYPPMQACTPQRAAAPGSLLATFHSMMVAPGWGRVVPEDEV